MGENELCTQKTGSWQTRSFSKCPREDKQTSAPKEKKSLQLVGKRAQILTGGIIVKEMRKVQREGGMKREETGEEGINDEEIEENECFGFSSVYQQQSCFLKVLQMFT